MVKRKCKCGKTEMVFTKMGVKQLKDFSWECDDCEENLKKQEIEDKIEEDNEVVVKEEATLIVDLPVVEDPKPIEIEVVEEPIEIRDEDKIEPIEVEVSEKEILKLEEPVEIKEEVVVEEKPKKKKAKKRSKKNGKNK